MDEQALRRWVEGLSAELGIESPLDIDTVLGLAADAAHGVMRPAAPLTTYLVGVAVGQSNGDPERSVAAVERVRQAIAQWNTP